VPTKDRQESSIRSSLSTAKSTCGKQRFALPALRHNLADANSPANTRGQRIRMTNAMVACGCEKYFRDYKALAIQVTYFTHTGFGTRHSYVFGNPTYVLQSTFGSKVNLDPSGNPKAL